MKGYGGNLIQYMCVGVYLKVYISPALSCQGFCVSQAYEYTDRRYRQIGA